MSAAPNPGGTGKAKLDTATEQRLRAFIRTRSAASAAKMLGMGEVTLDKLLGGGLAAKATVERVTAKLAEVAS